MTVGIRYPGELLPRPFRRLFRLIDLALAARQPMLLPAALGLAAAPRVELSLDGVRYSLRTRPVRELHLDLGIVWEVCRARVYPIPMDPELTIIDAGAHRGHFTLWAAARRPDARIEAYEPDDANTAELAASIARNGLAPRVAVHREAIAAGDGVRTFRRGHRSDAGRLADGGTVTVRAVGLRTVLERCPPGPVFMKMDAEGAEHEAFAALAATPSAADRIVAIALEWHPPTRREIDVRLSLGALGFAVRMRELRAGNAIVHAERRRA